VQTPSFTIKVFGVYVIVGVGLPLLLAPNLFLSFLGVPPTEEIWVHMLGLVVTILGYYYLAAGFGNARPFFVATVYGRFGICAGCIGFMLLLSAPWQGLIFGVIDVVGALWTSAALRSEAVAQPGVPADGPRPAGSTRG